MITRSSITKSSTSHKTTTKNSTTFFREAKRTPTPYNDKTNPPTKKQEFFSGNNSALIARSSLPTKDTGQDTTTSSSVKFGGENQTPAFFSIRSEVLTSVYPDGGLKTLNLIHKYFFSNFIIFNAYYLFRNSK